MSELARLTHIDPYRIESLLKETPQTQLPAPEPITVHWQRTPIRLALALLIQNPNLFTSSLPIIDSASTTDVEYNLLTMLIQHLSECPHANTALLLEYFRDSQWFDLISQFAIWDHQVPNQSHATELMEMLQSLTKKNRESVIQNLISKSKQQALSIDERKTLQDMLRERHLQ